MTPTEVIDALRTRGWQLALAESCTGGLVAASITDIAGASDVFDRGFVTYSNRAKIDMLGVLPGTLARTGAVSEEVAAEMATGALSRSEAQVALAVTGIAGPGGSENKPEGRVCFAVADPAGVTSETVEFGAIGRAVIRRQSVMHGLGLIAKAAR